MLAHSGEGFAHRDEGTRQSSTRREQFDQQVLLSLSSAYCENENIRIDLDTPRPFIRARGCLANARITISSRVAFAVPIRRNHRFRGDLPASGSVLARYFLAGQIDEKSRSVSARHDLIHRLVDVRRQRNESERFTGHLNLLYCNTEPSASNPSRDSMKNSLL
jgi:hypothetical protein